ncbi:putative membrane protein [Methanomicrobium sp. W14]|uniref:DUF63 family protein n=1 Tax=Methanomicrobium sp. W14 TaxID=2817839 RepID=UPI001AE82A3C|nr:DUF63 family protein [Methanomicrobium sp. W14]MBP2132776.1 putative membrane protein [Methanomicrobium sp. W14]
MIGDFIYKYYVGPIINGGAYTVVDTLTYAAILIIAVYLVYRWLLKANISIDHEFVLSLIPYVVLGGLLRVVEDTGIIPYPWYVLLITPLIYFVIFFYAISALVISRILERKKIIERYSRGFSIAGIFACVVSLIPLLYVGITETQINLFVMMSILGMASVTSLLVWGFIRHILKWEYVSDILYKLLIFGHMLDASATSFGIDLHELHYVEQHVVGSALINSTGTAFSMFALKLIVIIPGIYILEMYRKEGSQPLWHLILFAMIMVGMAPGIRDMVRMILYV